MIWILIRLLLDNKFRHQCLISSLAKCNTHNRLCLRAVNHQCRHKACLRVYHLVECPQAILEQLLNLSLQLEEYLVVLACLILLTRKFQLVFRLFLLYDILTS